LDLEGFEDFEEWDAAAVCVLAIADNDRAVVAPTASTARTERLRIAAFTGLNSLQDVGARS
jgi:hypothetical protein